MKNKQAIIPLFIANTISGFAQGITVIAIPWYFADILNLPSLWRVIYACVTFISLFWGLYVGTLVDRFNRKHLFIAETLSGGILLTSMGLFGYYNDGIPLALVAFTFAYTFFTYNLHYPSLYAFAQEITDKKDYSRITSYLEIQGQTTSVIAGAIGAMLLSGVNAGPTELLGFSINIPFSIPAWSLQKVFLLDGCTYLLAFLFILSIRYVPISKRYKENLSLVERFRVGIDFFKKYPLIFLYGNAAYFVFVTTMVSNFALIPDFVRNSLQSGAEVFALSETFFGLGAVISGFFIVLILRRTTTVMGNILTTLITASTFFFLIFNRNVGLFLLCMLLLGIANSGSRIMRVTYLFAHVPNQVIGRIQGILQVINVLIRLFFLLLFSLPFFITNISWTFGIFSLLSFFAAGVLIWFYNGLISVKTEEVI